MSNAFKDASGWCAPSAPKMISRMRNLRQPLHAYHFRFFNDQDGSLTGYVGFVAGRDLAEVFNTIDEFGDPHRAQLRKATHGGLCFYNEDMLKLQVAEGEECGDARHEIDEHTSMRTLDAYGAADGWFTPEWPHIVPYIGPGWGK